MTSPTPEPCSEERLEELVAFAALPCDNCDTEAARAVLARAGFDLAEDGRPGCPECGGTRQTQDCWLTPGELAWLVSEARDARAMRLETEPLRAELEAARAETQLALAALADQRERLEKLQAEREEAIRVLDSGEFLDSVYGRPVTGICRDCELDAATYAALGSGKAERDAKRCGSCGGR